MLKKIFFSLVTFLILLAIFIFCTNSHTLATVETSCSIGSSTGVCVNKSKYKTSCTYWDKCKETISYGIYYCGNSSEMCCPIDAKCVTTSSSSNSLPPGVSQANGTPSGIKSCSASNATNKTCKYESTVKCGQCAQNTTTGDMYYCMGQGVDGANSNGFYHVSQGTNVCPLPKVTVAISSASDKSSSNSSSSSTNSSNSNSDSSSNSSSPSNGTCPNNSAAQCQGKSPGDTCGKTSIAKTCVAIASGACVCRTNSTSSSATSGTSSSTSSSSSSTTPTTTPTPTLTLTPTPTVCATRSSGDADCDGKTNGIDFSLWLHSLCGSSCSNLTADFNNDNIINESDYYVWFTNRE